MAAADGVDNNATKPTQGNYASVGVTGVDSPVKATLLSDVVDSKTNADVDTVQELQDLANAVGATVGYTGTQTGPTDSQLNALTGESTVTPDNLAAIKAAIAQANGGSTPITTQEQLKEIIAAAVQSYQTAALNAIKDAAENNTATLTSPSAEQYAAAGVVDVTPNNLGAVNSALNSALVNGSAADTVEKVQGIVNAYKAILAEANGSASDATPNVDPSAAQYAAVGVTGVDDYIKRLIDYECVVSKLVKGF